MAIKPRRIGIELLDEKLLAFINASMKIFPISYEDILNNHNPNLYEYGRIKEGERKNEIYVWDKSLSKWEIIGADDLFIEWKDIIGVPLAFNPTSHTHNAEDILSLNIYTKQEVNTFIDNINLALEKKIDQMIFNNAIALKLDLQEFKDFKNNLEFLTEEEKILLGQIVNKADKTYVDTELNKKSDLLHNHDGRYIRKEELTLELSKKADKLDVENHVNNNLIHITKEFMIDGGDFSNGNN